MRWSRWLAMLMLFAALAALPGCRGHAAPARKGDPLRVAAASDLARAFGELGKVFEESTGTPVKLTFGSTGLLARQIMEGAPYDVFAAANASFVDDVVRDSACFGDTKRVYARGRIVMWSSEPSRVPARIEELRDGRYAKVAIANPAHAPYGLAAQQALIRSGVWEDVKPRAVYGDNVQQTMMFAASGNADVAIVALSLAVAMPGAYTAIDPALHEPLDQTLVVCRGGATAETWSEARSFVDFVGSPSGRAIMQRYGFLLPAEGVGAPASVSRGAPRPGGVDFGPLALSFEVATLATLLAAIIGIGAAAILANFRFRGRDVLDVIFTAPMVMPPTVLGYYVLVVLGRRSAIGQAYESITGTSIVFTVAGAVLAAAIGAVPLVVKNVRAAFEDTDPTLILAARTLGATRVRAFLSVQMPLAKRGIAAALMLAFARAIGDFGITLMVAGDIPGKTRTASLAIYDSLQAQRDEEAKTMVIVLTVLVLSLLYGVGKLTARRSER